MNLPVGIEAQETLHGRGDFITLLAVEDGRQVVVKTPDCSAGLFDDIELNDRGADDSLATTFNVEKVRENRIAETSDYFLSGQMLENEGASFWIRPYMKRSLQDMVSFKEVPDAGELGRICLKIASALAELNSFDQSGHGNLSLDNVLFSRTDVVDLKLVDLRAPHKSNNTADKRALGLIIYQLVNGEFVELDEKLSSVPDDQRWKFLGSTADKWRELCSELLNPFGKYAQATWGDIEKAIKQIAQHSGNKGKLFVVLVLLFAAVIGTSLFLKFRSGEKGPVVDVNKSQAQWLDLLGAYFSWGGVYLRSESDFKESRNAPDFVKRFYDTEKASLPTLVIAQVSGQGQNLIKSPNEAYREAKLVDVLSLDEAVMKQIVEADEVMSRIRSEIEEWSVIRKLEESHQAFTESGFNFGAEETQRLLSSISFEDGSLTLSRLYALQSSVQALDEMQGLYDQLDTYITRFRTESKSGFISLSADYYTQRLRQATADDPVAYLRSLVTDAAHLNTFWRDASPGIFHELFHSSESDFLSSPQFARSETTLSRWKALVADFTVIELPALNETVEQFRRAQKTFQELTEQINDFQEEGVSAVTYDQDFAALFERFNSEIDMPLISKNRERIEDIADRRSRDLEVLMARASNRWAEVGPDISERLGVMGQPLDTISGALFARWEAYLDREVRILSEASFDSRRAFNIFKQAYISKREAFQSFYDVHWSRIAAQLPGTVRERLATEMVPIVDSLRQTLYQELMQAWVDEVSPVLLSGQGVSGLNSMATRYESRMGEYDDKLIAYSSQIASGLQSIEEWKEPQGGYVQLWNRLHADELYIAWGQDPGFRPYLQRIEFFKDLAQESEPVSLLEIVMDSAQTGFARFTALMQISALENFSHELIVQLEPTISQTQIQIPSHRQEDYAAALIAIWKLGYEDVIYDGGLREKVLLLADTYGVKATGLSGTARVDYELFSTNRLMSANKELYLEQPAFLAEVINTLATLPEYQSDHRLREIVRDLREVDLEEVESTFEGAKFIDQGWRVQSGESREKLVLEWNNHRLNFLLVEGEDENYFVSETECSIELFNDWMTEKEKWEELEESLPADMSFFMNRSYDPVEDYRYGMTLWQVSQSGLVPGGLELAEKLYLKILETEEQEFSKLEIGSQSVLSLQLPIQYLSASLAGKFAESMGMMLPTPKIWEALTVERPHSNGFFWQEWMDDNEKLSIDLASVLRNDSFYETQKILYSGFGKERPRLISRVDEPSNEDFKHLAGNVAEYLYDPEIPQFFVAGGSALSATADTWRSMHPIAGGMETTAFSDVGLRLALIAPDQSAYYQYRQILEAYTK